MAELFHGCALRSTEFPLSCLQQMQHQRILVVEDNTELRRMFRLALSLSGYDVQETGDGIDALRIVESHTPDLVVLDLVLHRLDGVSVQQELAAGADTSAIPIVIVTGSTIDTDPLDVACVLRKPVMPDELVNTVRRCLSHGAHAANH
jgi:DNA-binding response OmpR family regulator